MIPIYANMRGKKQMTINEAISIISECEDVLAEAIHLGYGYNLHDVKESLEKLEVLGMSWGDKLRIHSDFSVRRGKIYITNTTTHYEFKDDKWYVVWDNGVGSYKFVKSSKEYWAVQEEYAEFIDKLLSYIPVDYDLINNRIIYDIENGKELIADYVGIINETGEKMKIKIKAVELEEAKEKYEKLLAERGETTNA